MDAAISFLRVFDHLHYCQQYCIGYDCNVICDVHYVSVLQDNGLMALLFASEKGNADVINILLQHHAQVDIQSNVS